MALPRKKPDPLTDKARALNDEIAALEAQIKKLDTQLQRTPTPKFRSIALPKGSNAPREEEKPAPPPPKPEPVFEELKQSPLAPHPEKENPGIYNDLGVRKYDLPALWSRIRNNFRGPTTSNPRLVNYLAAGGVQGLRPLRYEKRIARNRVIALSIGLFILLFGIFWWYMTHR